MATIVEYSNKRPPLNMYPRRIVSPVRGKTCCARKMVQIGGIEREGERSYFYRRCKLCGYTVRHFLSAPPPDPAGGQWEDGSKSLLKLVG